MDIQNPEMSVVDELLYTIEMFEQACFFPTEKFADELKAIALKLKCEARSVFGQDGVTTFDTETLDSEIDLISDSMLEKHFFDNDESDELELLVAKSMKLGELYERKKWQETKAQAVPEGFVLAHKELPEHIAESMALERVELPSHESSPTWAKISEDAYKGRLHSKKWELWRDYKEMIQAQEQGHE